jgi:adenine-specific DNA-methyltransferase
MAKKTKLELTWIGKDERPRLEPRILLEDSELSYHAARQVTERDEFDNRVIYGDNLLALKALESEFTGKVKCIYIDPPYNTGSAFTHYDDGLEHSLWLTMMRDRLELLRRLLTVDGSIWISVDDNEGHYAKVLCDEVFGRDNFIATFIWQKVDSPNDNKVPITPDHEFILCYSRTPQATKFKQKQDLSLLNAYRTDEETGKLYRDRLLKKNGKNSLRKDRPSMFFAIKDPDGGDVFPIHDDGQEACWAYGREGINRMIANGELIWKRRELNGIERWVPYTREFAPESPARPYPTIWTDVLTSRQAKAHQRELLPGTPPFDTVKPEQLVARILAIATEEGDLVLDSFVGSGTTGAVAHKMNRRFVVVELGEHVHTHILPRLRKVVDGEDPGGITSAVNWRGGGGFRYFRLAPSLLVQDRYGNYVINRDYNAEMLAEAMCKHENFTYAPSETVYWQHGRSSETDFIYVTTQSLTHAQLVALSEDVGTDHTLLVCAFAFRARDGEFPNLTFKKIPNAVLHRCEWGRDDYSLQIAQLPPPDEASGAESNTAAEPAPANGKARRKRRSVPAAATLFTDAEGGEGGKNISEA